MRGHTWPGPGKKGPNLPHPSTEQPRAALVSEVPEQMTPLGSERGREGEVIPQGQQGSFPGPGREAEGSIGARAIEAGV